MKRLSKNYRSLIVKEGPVSWVVPLKIIADNRGQYYAGRDKENWSAVYEEEYDLTIQDDQLALEWFLNNMDWEDVADFATRYVDYEAPTAPNMSKAKAFIE